MNKATSQQEEKLDQLLELARPVSAPAWFEARTLARLRREREQGPTVALWFLRSIGVAGATCLLAVGIFGLMQQDSKVLPPLAQDKVVPEQGQVFAALEAFASYTSDAEEWSHEPY